MNKAIEDHQTKRLKEKTFEEFVAKISKEIENQCDNEFREKKIQEALAIKDEKLELVFNQNFFENSEASENPIVYIDEPDVSNHNMTEESTGSEQSLTQMQAENKKYVGPAEKVDLGEIREVSINSFKLNASPVHLHTFIPGRKVVKPKKKDSTLG